jgi:hypothetical protein
MGHPSAPNWEIGLVPLLQLVASRAVVSLRPTRRTVARVLIAVLMLSLLAPEVGSASNGLRPSSADAHAVAAKKKRKKKRKKHVRCKRYRKVRVKRHHHRVTVRRCVHKKRKKKSTNNTSSLLGSPIAPLPAGIPGFTMGMVSGPAAAWEAQQMPGLHPTLVRFAVDIDTSAADLQSQISGLAAHGIQALPMAAFYGRVPSTAEAQNLANWAHAFGPGGTFWQGRSDGYLAMRHIEFGNETNDSYQFNGCGPGCSTFTSRAQQYALRAKDAALAIKAANPNVSLLAQGDSGGCWCSQWLDGMFSAVPNLNQLIGGWTVHPYGPKQRYAPSLDEMVRDTAKHGDTTLPFYATEYGISTDNGRCLSDNYMWPKCLTYAQAGSDLMGAIADMHATYGTRLAAVMIFEQRDMSDSGTTTNREGYFGAYQHDFAPKGAYTTAVQSLLAAFRG